MNLVVAAKGKRGMFEDASGRYMLVGSNMVHVWVPHDRDICDLRGRGSSAKEGEIVTNLKEHVVA